MWVKFWGVRGSIPCPGPATVRYGGNTACLEIRFESIDRLIIVDAGTGIRELGNHLMAQKKARRPIRADIFLTHTHWDHIMGLPFFTPIFQPDTRLRIYGPVTFEEETLRDVLSGQWTYRYFPIRTEDLISHVEYYDLKEGEYDMGQGIRVVTTYLNHPLLCLGYRFEFEGKTICTVFDTEPFFNVFSADPNQSNYDPDLHTEGQRAALEENRRIERFVAGADLLIYDSQYTQDEYENGRMGWGHSTVEHGLSLARPNGVKRLALFHYDVNRTDRQLDEMAQKYSAFDDDGLDVFFAHEGMTVDI